MGLRISDLKKVFGAQSPQARAAEFVDSNAPTARPGGGGRARIRTSRNDLFDLVEAETKISKDILFPPDLKDAFQQLVGISRPSGVPVESGLAEFRAGDRRWTSKQTPTTEVDIQRFKGTDFEAAVTVMLDHQTRKDVLERATVEKFESSTVFHNRFPNVLHRLTSHYFQPEERRIPPPPTVEKVAIQSADLRITARVHNAVKPGTHGVSHRYELVIKTLPNAVVTVRPTHVHQPNPNLRTPKESQVLESTQVVRADANGLATVRLNKQALDSRVNVFDPDGRKLEKSAEVAFRNWA